MTFKGNVLKPLAKSVLMPIRLTVAASATDAAIHKKVIEFGLLIKGLSETIKNEAK